MQRIFSALGGVLVKRILMFGLIGLLSVSGLFIFVNQPALADNPLSAKMERASKMNEAAGLRQEPRQESYDEVTEAISSDPKQGLEEIYEEDLQEYKEENPDKGGLLEGAKELVDKVTGQD
ncbi:MAG: hypothetical protein Fur006_07150 [Coleofasciculaceae cyanobacterium]|jgi:hypothetical protein